MQGASVRYGLYIDYHYSAVRNKRTCRSLRLYGCGWACKATSVQNAAGKRRQIARAAPIRAACGTPLAELPEHGSSNAVTRYSRYSRSDAAPDIAVTRYSRYSRFGAAPGNVCNAVFTLQPLRRSSRQGCNVVFTLPTLSQRRYRTRRRTAIQDRSRLTVHRYPVPAPICDQRSIAVIGTPLSGSGV